MALTPSFQTYQNLSTGTILRVQDDTGSYDATDNPGGYGSPNIAQSDVTVCRFIYSDYVSEEDASDSVTSLTAYKEYENDGDAAITVDGKSIAAGATFIPVVDVSTFTKPIGYEGAVKETGRREAVSDFLPTDTHIDFAPDELMFDDEKFPDRVYSLQYEVYSGTITTGSIAADQIYYVQSSTSTDRVAYNGSSYRPGEVFTGVTGVTAFTTTGSPTVTKREAVVDEHFGMWYWSNYYIQNLLMRWATRQFPTKCLDTLNTEISALQLDFEGMKLMAIPNNLDITGATSIINHIAQEYDRIIDQYT